MLFKIRRDVEVFGKITNLLSEYQTDTKLWLIHLLVVQRPADNTIRVGNRLRSAPEHSFNLWTTYKFQEGDLKGFGFGLGLFYVGDRQGDLGNTFVLPSYLRTDAAIFYEQDRFRAALNIENLFDVDYFVTARSIVRVDRGAPLSVRATLSWRF